MLHRDMSENNIMQPIARRELKACLIDMDLGNDLNSVPSGANHRTWTWGFSAKESGGTLFNTMIPRMCTTYCTILQLFLMKTLRLISYWGIGFKIENSSDNDRSIYWNLYYSYSLNLEVHLLSVFWFGDWGLTKRPIASLTVMERPVGGVCRSCLDIVFSWL